MSKPLGAGIRAPGLACGWTGLAWAPRLPTGPQSTNHAHLPEGIEKSPYRRHEDLAIAGMAGDAPETSGVQPSPAARRLLLAALLPLLLQAGHEGPAGGARCGGLRTRSAGATIASSGTAAAR